jgi:protein phosphatase
MTPSDEVDEDEIIELPGPKQVQPPEPATAAVEVELGAQSNPGLVRPNNEDHYLVVRGQRVLESLLTNLPEGEIPPRHSEVAYGLMVADGIGGHAAGEVASRVAIGTLVNLVLNTPEWIMRWDAAETDEVMNRASERFLHIDEVLRDRARADPHLHGMGTTLTLAISLGAELILAHVGDSRAYLFRGGQLHQLTRDHTMAQVMVKLGMVPTSAAINHPLRHVLMNALGGRGNPPTPEVEHITLKHDDQLLLCTDGLTDLVDDATIGAILSRAGSASTACQTLVETALRNGGKDNVTAVLGRYRFPASSSAENEGPHLAPVAPG